MEILEFEEVNFQSLRETIKILRTLFIRMQEKSIINDSDLTR